MILRATIGEGQPGYASISGSMVTLAHDTTAMQAGDVLFFAYDDGLAQLGANAATADRQDTQTARLASILTALGPLGTDATLQAILTVLQAQRAETLWTDDTEAYFVRVDKGGTITWTTPAGAASAAPGTGARPADNTSAVVDGSRYQAVNAGTGYNVGDYISHVVTTDPQTGVVVGHYWINVTTEVKLASGPASADITPIAPLPAGAATATRQDAGNTSLAAVAAALGTTGDAATASGVASTMIGALRAIRDRVAQDGTDPASPAVANAGTGIRGWLATIAGLLKLGATTKANSASMTIATDQGNLEPGGTAITAAAMPGGGVGLTGWLSAIWAAVTRTNVLHVTAIVVTGTRVVAAGAAGGDPTVISTGARKVWAVSGFTTVGGPRFAKLYDKASAPTASDTPVAVYGIPASSGFNVAIPAGMSFANGLALRIVQSMTDTDNTATAGGDVVVTIQHSAVP